MKKVFNPGFIVFEMSYDQGSSGGQTIAFPANLDSAYYDKVNDYTYIFGEFGDEGSGWYYYIGEDMETFFWGGPEGSIDFSGMEELG